MFVSWTIYLFKRNLFIQTFDLLFKRLNIIVIKLDGTIFGSRQSQQIYRPYLHLALSIFFFYLHMFVSWTIYLFKRNLFIQTFDLLLKKLSIIVIKLYGTIFVVDNRSDYTDPIYITVFLNSLCKSHKKGDP